MTFPTNALLTVVINLLALQSTVHIVSLLQNLFIIITVYGKNSRGNFHSFHDYYSTVNVLATLNSSLD